MLSFKPLLVFATLFSIGMPHVQAQTHALRTTFKDALVQAESLTDEQLAALREYPLYPYLEYRRLQQSIGNTPDNRLQAFIDSHADTPLAGRLLFAWARDRGNSSRWSSFHRAWQQIQRPDTRLQCQHAHYLLDTGQTRAAWNEARRLWTVGHSQPDECDPVFTAWLQSDHFREEYARQRHLAALTEGRPGLATYAARFVNSAALKQQLQLARNLYDQPELLLQKPQLLQADTPDAPRLLVMAVNRLARKDLEQAIRLWTKERKRLQITDEQGRTLSTRLGVRLAKRFPASGDHLFTQLDPEYALPEVTEWRIRLALASQDWPAVLDLLEHLPREKAESDRWTYWHAVALEQLNRPHSRKKLQTLAGRRSFYGFMAAQMLGAPYRLNHRPLSEDRETLSLLAQQPAFIRIRELLALERYYDARSEWNLAIRDLTPDQIHAASHLAKSWGWYDQAIRGAISSQRWNDMELRFPNPLPELFERHARTQSIDPAWALAIARQESAFWMQARSHAGALGLMQLMPATARATAKRHAIPLPSLSQLADPDTNIRLGTAYLSEMVQRFDGNLAYASAAYNAGPSRVNRWLDARGDLPLDIWIETIPFDETRNYVQNVLAFRVIYERLAQRPVSLFSPQEFSMLALYQSGER